MDVLKKGRWRFNFQSVCEWLQQTPGLPFPIPGCLENCVMQLSFEINEMFSFLLQTMVSILLGGCPRDDKGVLCFLKSCPTSSSFFFLKRFLPTLWFRNWRCCTSIPHPRMFYSRELPLLLPYLEIPIWCSLLSDISPSSFFWLKAGDSTCQKGSCPIYRGGLVWCQVLRIRAIYFRGGGGKAHSSSSKALTA